MQARNRANDSIGETEGTRHERWLSFAQFLTLLPQRVVLAAYVLRLAVVAAGVAVPPMKRCAGCIGYNIALLLGLRLPK